MQISGLFVELKHASIECLQLLMCSDSRYHPHHVSHNCIGFPRQDIHIHSTFILCKKDNYRNAIAFKDNLSMITTQNDG